MYSLISHRGIYNEAIKKYIIDYEIDIIDVPTDAPAGSECFVIENSSEYMLNHQKQWVKIVAPSGGGINIPGGPGGNIPEGEDIIYEGGVI